MRCAVAFLASVLLAGCAAPQYGEWYTPVGKRLLHSQFLEARVRMDEPYVLAGEDVERIYFTFRNQLRHLGDARFAAALSRERHDVIAAVAELIDVASLGPQFPKTSRVCESAPKISFPAVKITQEDRRRS